MAKDFGSGTYSPDPLENSPAAPRGETPSEKTAASAVSQGDKYAFKVRDLTKDYDGHVVLNNISFDIPRGKIVGLLGPNGCGKSTLMKILAGVIHDYTGNIKIGGRPIGIGSKAHLAYLPDRTYFPERFRTVDCINYFADFFADFDKVKAIEFAAKFGLDLNQRIKTMSKGMQEKLQLLMVMSRAADIYLLDEPLGGVDPAARAVILDIIMSNYKENATVVISTHLVNDLEHSFDHVLMLGHGSVLVNTGIDTLRSTGKSVEEIFKEVIGDAWEVD
ncbi:MAG: ABC transporter ATP-binding protein [Oscillospiraceae bacterium]|nr:ABC transporter ATP-binding protein [Oscillospiraceae bacterium]